LVELSASELKKSGELRSKTEKEIEKQTGYTKKRDQVLDNLTPMGKLKSSIKVDKELRKRRVTLFAEMYNARLTKESIQESKYLKRMFSGEKVGGVTFKEACEKAKKSDTIQAKVVENKSSANFSAWGTLGQGFKKALGFGKKNAKCPMCKQQLSKKKNKRKRHLQKCSEKMQSRQNKTRQTFVKNTTTKTITQDRHTSFRMGYDGSGLHEKMRERRGALSGGVY
jgi:hypothetical protein